MANPDDPVAKNDFANTIVNPEAALGSAVEWIRDNLQPGDVFEDEQLAAWALMRGYTAPPEEE